MKTTGPDEHGSAYINLVDTRNRITKTVEVTANLDIDQDGRILGVELLNCPDKTYFGA